MERWRVAFAIVAALAALPLLAIDNVSSADPERALAVESGDPAIALLSARAVAWTDAHEALREAGVQTAIAIAQQVKAEEAARLAQKAEEAEEQARREAEEKERREREAEAAKRAPKAESSVARRVTLSPPAPTASPTPRSGEPSAEQWAKLRACEASGNYRAVSSGGRFRGAYQFDQETWDHVARANFAHLVGVDPAAASPADQDAVALALYRARGTSPWPRCGQALR
ncbi:MAG TPA: transglycosylase family protein [Acidimicrobiales bacterium]